MKSLKVFLVWILANSLGLLHSVEMQDNFPEKLTEEWIGHNQEVSLLHSDEHVAIYFEEEMDKSLLPSFTFVSNAWKYCNETYGPFQQNSRLFLIFHQSWRERCEFLQLNESSKNPTFNLSTIIDCNKNRNTNDSFDIILEMAKITLELRFLKDIGYWPAKEVASTYISLILVYDIYRGNEWDFPGVITSSQDDFKRKLNWFYYWYLPIYDKYGKASVLNGFFANLYQHWRGSKSGQMNYGEFVHFWSGTAGEDLWELAYHASGWTNEDQAQLVEARNSFPELANLYSVKGLSSPPAMMTEKWGFVRENLTLAHSDDHVAFLVDSHISASTTWSFKLMSAAWKYTKETFGPFGPDPILYIVLHGQNYAVETHCAVSGYLEMLAAPNYNRKIIDCGTNTNGPSPWKRTRENADLLMQQMGEVVINFAKETKWNYKSIFIAAAANVFTLDIILQLNEAEYSKEWVNGSIEALISKYQSIISYSDIHNVLWFRDWWLPLYEKYGGSQFLNRFLTNVHDNWPRKGSNYIGSMRVGDLLHFCSGAAGVSLWNELKNIAGWKMKYHDQYLEARTKFPHLNYSDEVPPRRWTEDWDAFEGHDFKHDFELKLVYIDTHLAAYFDSRMDNSAGWSFELISNAWKYAQETFGPFGQDPYLYFVFHEGLGEVCAVNKRYNDFNGKIKNRTIVDCSWNDGRNYPRRFHQDRPVEMVAISTLQGSLEDSKWISVSTFVTIHAIMDWQLHPLLLFDIYMGIGRLEDGVRSLSQSLRYTRSGSPKPYKYWFRDWYYPIYAQYGNTSVIVRFCKLLRKFWPRGSSWVDYEQQMNVGEFVHFWSGAAGVDLKHLAIQSFGLEEDEEKQLLRARMKFPMVMYEDYAPPEISQPLFLEDYRLGEKEILFFIRANNRVTLYMDAYIKRNITWPFQFVSDSWENVSKIYSLIRESNATQLDLILRGKQNLTCRTIWNGTQIKDEEAAGEIDCGQDSRKVDAWMTASGKNKDLLISSFANIIQKSANQTKNLSAYYLQPMQNMIEFDLYMRMGEIEESYRILQKSFEREVQSAGTIFWFRNWYLPIYNNFGGVAVIDNFLCLLYFNWPLKNSEEMMLNIGELVHFWSAAAKVSVVNIAQRVLGWTQVTLDQFLAARKLLSHFEYSCDDCELPKQVTAKSWAVIAMSIFIGFGITFFLFVFLMYKMKVKQLKKQIRELTPEEVKEFYEGNVSAASAPESAPFNKQHEIPKEQLDIYYDKILGSGEFGLVLQGQIKIPFVNEIKVAQVAVKTVKSDVEINEFKVLMSELKVLAFLGRHKSIVTLMGAVTTNIRNRELFLALEFCAKGDVLSNLKKHRNKFVDLFHTKEINTPNENYGNSFQTSVDYIQLEEMDGQSNAMISNGISTADLLKWAIEISVGMDYIGSKNVIHGDLAARNVLLTAENQAKLCDFGLSRQLANYSKYTKMSKTPLPWRWMAIESLRDLEFSVKSDVWAFGVTLFEIFTLGAVPFSHCKWCNEFLDNVSAGLRLNAPDFGNNDIFHLMMDCMRLKPEHRISFGEIATKLEKINLELVKNI